MAQQERPASQKVKTILVIEDHAGIGAFLIDLLQAVTPYRALLATDRFFALEMVNEQRRIASLKKPVSVEQLLQRPKTLLEDQ